ncbi:MULTISPECIES: galactofuranosyltransferase [unclassified Streptococcus]|uniref:galactofuranosyltransferase n=1 Tax=unclassified Streptococcus TaxID=2608887 RepID=UPI0011B849C0|nr:MULTISPECIES: galactofuranosyltransferase [unclassified Streptococcus]TWS94609.1 galactofuranosyltransferase [Streptococcus sp. sy018]TWT14444.1 galactofuranosyltransferase [Streptococcus sp. sy010]
MDYIIETRNKGQKHAGAKAPDDIVAICQKRGMGTFSFPIYPSHLHKLIRQFWMLFTCVRVWLMILMKTKSGDRVIWQHPIYGIRYAYFFIGLIKKWKKVTFIALIHDLESLRSTGGDFHLMNSNTSAIADKGLLSRCDFVISHNQFMTNYLLELGIVKEKIVNLEIFDYLYKDVPDRDTNLGTPSVLIAGNLGPVKSPYIYKLLELPIDLRLYGILYEGDKDDPRYKGAFPPDELIEHLDANFGIVWDGTSLEECTGNTGQYLRFNNPHKTSLYLAAKLPIIVWRQAAIATFVLENGVGIAIDRLSDLPQVLANMSQEEYAEMLNNVNQISERIRTGYYTNKALDACQ